VGGTAAAFAPAELQHPAADRFIGHLEPALGQQILDVEVPEGEAQTKPYRVLDDRRREAMAAIRKQGYVEMLYYAVRRSLPTRSRDHAHP
jgi:hypothetical protein